MRDWTKSLVRVANAVLLAVACGGSAGRAQSIQWWPETDLSLTFNRGNVLIPSLVRLDSDLPNPQFVATGAIGTLRLDRHWSLSAGYLFANLPQRDQVAHVPLAAVTPSWTIRHWALSDINRCERLLAYSNEPFRYRNRAGADYTFGKERPTHLYASDEFFVNASAKSWNQNRAQIGVGVPVNHSTRLDVYFLQRSAPGGGQASVIGMVITIMVHQNEVR